MFIIIGWRGDPFTNPKPVTTRAANTTTLDLLWGSVSMDLYTRPLPGPLPYTVWAKLWIHSFPGVSVHSLLLELCMAMRLAAAKPPPTASPFTLLPANCVRRPPGNCVFTVSPKLCTGGALERASSKGLQAPTSRICQLNSTITQ